MEKQHLTLRLFSMRKLSPHIVPLLATLCAVMVVVSVSGHPVYLGQPKNTPSEKHTTQIPAKDKTQHLQPESSTETQSKTEENTEKQNKNKYTAQEKPEKQNSKKPSPKEKDSQYGEFFSLKLPSPSFSFQPTAYLPKDSPKHTYSPPLRIRKVCASAFLYALIPFRQILFTHYTAPNAP